MFQTLNFPSTTTNWGNIVPSMTRCRGSYAPKSWNRCKTEMQAPDRTYNALKGNVMASSTNNSNPTTTDNRGGFIMSIMSALMKHKKATGAGVAAVTAAIALAVATGSVALAAINVRTDTHNFPAGTTAVADPSTLTGFTTFPQADSYNTTAVKAHRMLDRG